MVGVGGYIDGGGREFGDFKGFETKIGELKRKPIFGEFWNGRNGRDSRKPCKDSTDSHRLLGIWCLSVYALGNQSYNPHELSL